MIESSDDEPEEVDGTAVHLAKRSAELSAIAAQCRRERTETMAQASATASRLERRAARLDEEAQRCLYAAHSIRAAVVDEDGVLMPPRDA